MCETAPNASSYSCTSPNSSVTSTYAYNGDGLRMCDTPAGESTQQFTWDTTGSVPNLLEDGTNYYLYGPNIGSAPLEQITIAGSTPTYLISGHHRGPGTAQQHRVRHRLHELRHLRQRLRPVLHLHPVRVRRRVHRRHRSRLPDRALLRPSHRQFLSSDPLVDETETPYSYADDDPVNGSDPSGLCDVPSGDPNQPFVHTHNGPCTRGGGVPDRGAG